MKLSIAGWRKERRMTQSELAERIGRTQKTISAWETGKSEPYPSDLDLMHKAMKLKATDHILLPKDLI